MSVLSELPDLENIIVEMIVEMLLIEKEQRFSELIYGPGDHPKSVRITMHYVMALLAYGFTPSDPELQKAADWFDTPLAFYNRRNFVDPSQMNHLHVLLHLRPDSPHVAPRLARLAQQRAGKYFDVQHGWHGFDTLWALEMFTRAHQAGVLTDDIMPLSAILDGLDRLIRDNDLLRHKDLTLALNLYHTLCGQLAPHHVGVLQKVLEMAETSGGMWGMVEFSYLLDDMPWYRQFLTGRLLNYDDIATYSSHFRKIIASSCMVIENLSPLREEYPHLRQPLEKALILWLRQLKSRNVITSLRALFSKKDDYDYLLILTRTLRALRGYLGTPLREMDSLYLLRELTKLRTDTSDTLETRNIKEALRRWLHFDLAEPPEKLTLGFSDASVVRVTPQVWSPLSSIDDRPTSLLNQSLIVKYGPTVEISKEREHYEALPAAILDCFVRIPEPSYTDREHDLSYVIMQDLHNYQTLYEGLDIIKESPLLIADQLGSFLIRVHEGGTSHINSAPRSLFRELYLSRTMEHIDRVFNFLIAHATPAQQQDIREVQHDIFIALGDIIRHQRHMEIFPQAYMHGDLHLRNIMVLSADAKRRSRRGQDLRFKLIDLEFTRRDGDAAFDIGQLAMDITMVAEEQRFAHLKDALLKMRDNLEHIYVQRFGLGQDGRDDTTFGVRVELAKARALLRIAKGKTKRGQRFVNSHDVPQLEQLCHDLVRDVHATASYLQKVVMALQQIVSARS